jgi:hydrogenase-1 operon protein HyaE
MSVTPLQRLVSSGQGQALDATAVDGFLARPGPALLVLTGDPGQRAEAQDVAVVASLLAKQVKGLQVGVVDLAAEEAVRPRFNVQVVPTLVFLKDGRPVSTVARLQDWAVYSRTASLVFGREKEVKA